MARVGPAPVNSDGPLSVEGEGGGVLVGPLVPRTGRGVDPRGLRPGGAIGQSGAELRPLNACGLRGGLYVNDKGGGPTRLLASREHGSPRPQGPHMHPDMHVAVLPSTTPAVRESGRLLPLR